MTGLPLALGFGLSTAVQIRQIKDKCDGIIIGSKILNIILEADNIDKGLAELRDFCRQIVKEL